jgi:hypothetical protein
LRRRGKRWVSLLASLLPACNFQHCFIGTHARIFAVNVIFANGEKIPDSHDIRFNILYPRSANTGLK